jgi:hypothetical protein
MRRARGETAGTPTFTGGMPLGGRSTPPCKKHRRLFSDLSDLHPASHPPPYSLSDTGRVNRRRLGSRSGSVCRPHDPPASFDARSAGAVSCSHPGKRIGERGRRKPDTTSPLYHRLPRCRRLSNAPADYGNERQRRMTLASMQAEPRRSVGRGQWCLPGASTCRKACPLGRPATRPVASPCPSLCPCDQAYHLTFTGCGAAQKYKSHVINRDPRSLLSTYSPQA